jgi:hypothetical protein
MGITVLTLLVCISDQALFQHLSLAVGTASHLRPLCRDTVHRYAYPLGYNAAHPITRLLATATA